MAPKIPVNSKSPSGVVIHPSAKSLSVSDTKSESECERFADTDDTDDSRVRKHHTRSRVGCLTCRKRHVRCDGNQPECARCMQGRRTCIFPPPDPPLRERRGFSLPGEQKPWYLTANKMLPSLSKRALCLDKLEPFDCLPIRLPKKSAELLTYYHQINDSYDISSKANDKDVLPYLIQNATSIRHTLLISGIHQMWLSGDTKTFHSTVLYHKIETMQQLNKELQNVRLGEYTSLIKHVATLALVECALGNMGPAETHLDCLVAILDHYSPSDEDDTDITFEEELAYRYLSLVYNVIHNVKSRMMDSPELHQLASQSDTTDFTTFYHLILKLHAQDLGCLRIQFQAAAMYPFFFGNLPSATKFYDIDDSVGIGCLRSLTESIQSGKSDHPIGSPEWGWVEGSLARVHLAVMNTHVESLFNTTEGAPTDPLTGQKLISCWFGISVAHGFYMHVVLGIWNGNEPMNRHLLRLMMKVYVRQQEQPSQRSNMHRSSDLWFWQHFVTAYFLEQHQMYSYDPALDRYEQYFDSAILDWSQAFGVTHWDQAQKRLLGVAWPTNHPQDVPKQLWQRALRYEGSSNPSPREYTPKK